MKSLILLAFLSVVIKGYSQTETPEQTLAKMEDKRIKAVIARDSMTLVALYDDRYRGVLANGRPVNKSGVIEFQMSNNPHVKITIEGVEATIYGDVGFTTGTQVNKSKTGTILGKSKFIRVYKKTGNTWKIVSSQGTMSEEGF